MKKKSQPPKKQPKKSAPKSGHKGKVTVNEMADLFRDLLALLEPETPDKAALEWALPPTLLVGRAADVATLREQIESGVVAGVVLHGPAGVGKTALARQLIAELAAVYNDAQYCFDGRQDAAAVMAQVLHAQEPLRRLPEARAELSKQYRAALRGRRTLLLLDNASDAASVEALLPYGSGIVLATAAQALTVPELLTYRVEPLSPDASRALLVQLEPQLEPHATALATLCDGLPLALRLVAGAVRVGPKVTAAAYTQQLTKRRQTLAPLDAVLALNTELLPPVPQQLWRELSVFPTSFDATAAAALWEMLPEQSWESLPSLVGKSLQNLLQRGLIETTEPQPEPEENLAADLTRRYWLHEAVRAAAATGLSQTARHAAERRHAEHYWNAAEMMMTLCRSGAAGQRLALDLCDREWLNIAAGRAWAVAHAATDAEAAEWAADYLYFGIPALIFRLSEAELTQWLRDALDIGTRSASELLGQIGSAYQDADDVPRAVAYCRQALAAAQSDGDRASIQRALGGLGDSYYQRGQLNEAIEMYQQYLALVRASGDRKAEAFVLNNLGAAYGELGRASEAIACFEQQLAFLRDSGDYRDEARISSNIGITHIKSGDTQAAIARFRAALDLYRAHRDREGEAEMLQNLGGAHVLAGDCAAAIAAYEQAVPLHRKRRDRRATADAWWNMSQMHNQLGNRPRAIECATEALKLHEAMGDPRAITVRRQLAQWRGK